MVDGKIILGDCREAIPRLADGSIDSCITSPPYWGCRDYGAGGQVGADANPLDYVADLAGIFAALKQKLSKAGNLFVIIDDVWVSNWTRRGDSAWVSSKSDHEGSSGEDFQDECAIKRNWAKDLGIPWMKAKQKLLLPERLTIKMQEEQGWYFREKIIWYKPNAGNYTNIRDRFAHAYEYVLHFTRAQQYFANMGAIKDPGSGKLQRDVLSIPIERNASKHTATFPRALAGLLVEFSCPPGGTVLDPFCGTGTTLVAAKERGRKYVGIEISKDYHAESVANVANVKKKANGSLDDFTG